MTVYLKDIIDALETTSDDWQGFYDKQTGEILWVGDADFDDEREETCDLIENSVDRFCPLPDRWDIHEYSIIEKFVYGLPDGQVKNQLLYAIRGSGAFRRFKDTLRYHGIEQQWYDYKEEAYKQIAVRWCEDNGFDYKS